MEKHKILVIEDDQDVRDSLKLLLSRWYTVTASPDGLSGIRSSIKNPPDLILLDLRMPKINGFDTCKALREDDELKKVPILILTAYNTSKDRKKAFQAGADDFISKPFDIDELLLRIERKLHGASFDPPQKDKAELLTCGNLKLDLVNQEALVNNATVHLSGLEFRLLTFFVQNCDRVMSREEITEHVWAGTSASLRLVDTHIVSLRNKIAACSHNIVSIYKAGYVLKSKR